MKNITNLAISCTSGGYKNAFTQGVLTAFEENSLIANVYAACSSSALIAAFAAFSKIRKLDLTLWKNGYSISQEDCGDQSRAMLHTIKQLSPEIIDNLWASSSSEQEQAKAMKRYIREVFIPKYAKNFNKGLSASDIKFYGKIHFDRNRSDNELNMHCHLIVSRKDQANKKKLSPLTNHKNTKKGTIKGGFDRKNLFLQVEQGFDKVFDYNRQQTESFNYHNTMKNGSILEQLELQEQKIVGRKTIDVQTNENVKTTSNISIQQQFSISVNQSTNNSVNQSSDRDALSFLFPILPSVTDFNPRDKQQQLRHKKKKKRKLGLS